MIGSGVTAGSNRRTKRWGKTKLTRGGTLREPITRGGKNIRMEGMEARRTIPSIPETTGPPRSTRGHSGT